MTVALNSSLKPSKPFSLGGMNLATILILLAAAVVAVPLSKRFGLGAVMGYLLAGVLIGPSGFKLIGDVDTMLHASEFGVVMLLFLIGLELKPSRLWLMRKAVFGMGSAQVAFSGLAIGGVCYLFGFSWQVAVVAGCGLALSSTALVLPMLAEHKQLSSQMGRDSFAILLFQDLIIIPMASLLPLLGAQDIEAHIAAESPWLAVGRSVAAVAVLFLGGRYLIRPLFRVIEAAKAKEIFTATALLVVVATAALADAVGLSMSLGAFLGGVILADSEYRHEIQADIEPFEGLLLGLFFLSVGMMADLQLVWQQPLRLIGFVAAIMAAKALVLYLIGRVVGHTGPSARRLGFSMSQGGEFAFVLFAVVAGVGVIAPATRDFLVLAVTASMILTPLLFALNEKLLTRFFERPVKREFDAIEDGKHDESQVIICGFGRMGQIVGRVLTVRKIPFTALENSAAQVDFMRRFGAKVYYGDPTRMDLLRAAGAETAKAIVVAGDDIESSVKTVELVRHHFPHLTIIARARNRQHAFRLMDAEAHHVVRETFHSSLMLAETLLGSLGYDVEEAHRFVKTFKNHDESLLKKQYEVKDDEAKVIQTSREAAAELRDLFEQDIGAKR